MTELGVTGGYVRHRDRMIQQSVYEDLRDVLIACRWLPGTTSNPVWNVSTGVWETVTTASNATLPLLEGSPLNLIDYFPESEGDRGSVGQPTASKTPLNTFALDNGTPSTGVLRELGNRSSELVQWRFNMAFYAASDAVAQAVLSDLRDRYRGRLARPDFIDLWDYNAGAEDPVVRMSVESFSYVANTDQSVAPYEVHLYFGELVLEDEVD